MEELEQVGGNIYDVPSLTPDQESLCGMSIRIITAIEEILVKEKGKHIGIVGHGDATRVYMDRLLHPRHEVPSVARDKHYLKKGEAWWLSFDSKFILKEGALIAPERQSSSSVERKMY
ncbi:MAG TPA: histidine phosphatase family protein [Patescibacteria group bacterium]|nr:histidine phosphatase family protein [Patescibacteria group bacterium]